MIPRRARAGSAVSSPPFEFRGGLFSNRRFGPRRPLWGGVMARLLFGTVLVAALGVPLVAMFQNEASAQERATCSQARAHCGTPRACERRCGVCTERGRWTG